jgi:hypothetical protein
MISDIIPPTVGARNITNHPKRTNNAPAKPDKTNDITAATT